MSEQEIARQGEAFRRKVAELFHFLVAEYGFSGPHDVEGEYRHVLAYKCRDRGQALVFTNAFHPVDYGFEITSNPFDPPWRVDARHVLYYVPKEDQDLNHEFLRAGVTAVRRALAGG